MLTSDVSRSAGDATPDLSIGMIIYDRMTNLDFVGPADMFSRQPSVKIHVLAKSHGPVITDSGTRVLPSGTLQDAPKLDILFIGGGPGSTQLMEDEEVLAFLQDRAGEAQWITSVCTGALVLGAAGLLQGYKAASHWTTMDILPLLGATPVHQRVVIDRNRITGGGVTAGIDFALKVIATILGDEQAQLVQLGSEYNPEPPFDAGSPSTAPAAVVEKFLRLSGKMTQARIAAAQRAAGRFSLAHADKGR